MLFRAPEFKNRTPEQIVTEEIDFDSVTYIYRALSWLDIARRDRNAVALHYAALEVRMGIEQLLFEQIVLSVGTQLDRQEYGRIKGNSTKLHKILKRLNPDYERLAEFTRAVAATDPNTPPLTTWSHSELMKQCGKVSNYLHWGGEPAETSESPDWVDSGIKTISEAANLIWKKKLTAYTGVMMPDRMQPEIRRAWERFKAEEIDLDAVTRIAKIAHPILSNRARAERMS
jgi:hypothetical protein